ncbi:MAG: 4Fe-4S binding protein [Eggerthellaceae bacterium]
MGGFKLGKMTLRSLFKKPITTRYPYEEPKHPDSMKGAVECNIEECISCSKCVKHCPTNSITVDREKKTWSIDRFSCIQCGSCIRECPKHCLSMNPVLLHPTLEKSVVLVERPPLSEAQKQELAAKEAEKAARIKAAKEAKAAREKANAQKTE